MQHCQRCRWKNKVCTIADVFAILRLNLNVKATTLHLDRKDTPLKTNIVHLAHMHLS